MEAHKEIDSSSAHRSEAASTHQNIDGDSETAPFLLDDGAHSLSRRLTISRAPCWFLFDAVLVVIIILLASFHTHLRAVANTGPEMAHHLDLQGDFTGYVPHFSHRIVVFQPQLQFVSNHSSEESLVEAREAWKTIVPPGQGFLDISDELAQQYDFPKLISYSLPAKVSTTGHDRHGKSLGTSVVHSLHCLYTIMAEYDLAYQGHQPLSLGHMDHCFEYIRQVIMCGGDLALAGETFPGGSSQFGVPHVCKNWDEIYAFLDRHRVSTEWQFGDALTHFVPPT